MAPSLRGPLGVGNVPGLIHSGQTGIWGHSCPAASESAESRTCFIGTSARVSSWYGHLGVPALCWGHSNTLYPVPSDPLASDPMPDPTSDLFQFPVWELISSDLALEDPVGVGGVTVLLGLQHCPCCPHCPHLPTVPATLRMGPGVFEPSPAPRRSACYYQLPVLCLEVEECWCWVEGHGQRGSGAWVWGLLTPCSQQDTSPTPTGPGLGTFSSYTSWLALEPPGVGDSQL